MIWRIRYSAQARQDLHLILEYIANELLVPDIANKQVQRIMAGIRSLSSLPLRYALYKEEPWKSYGLRILPIGNYLVFYIVEEKLNQIAIVRIMYGGRDLTKQLSKKRT